jgi:gamma-glutamyltranspeptidase/glutathione hydrolase
MHRRKKSARLAALVVLSLAWPAPAPAQAPQADAAGTPEVARGTKGMVVAAEPFAAEAGIEILRQGGNAVDAAVAVAFALAVTHPAAGNLGGGGFMLIRKANGRATFVDYRETAPAAARPDMYLDDKGELIPKRSTEGWQAAGIPGTVAGLELALRVHGTMSLHQVLQPAIRLAQKGFPVSERLARSLERNADRLGRDPESRKIFLRNGRPYQPGETFKQKDLARTLKRIADRGAREFYEGWLAERFVKESKKGGGLFTGDDLKGYRAVLRAPLRGSFRGYEIVTAPPPSSGGVALLETLNMLEPLLADTDRPDDPAVIHLVAEALRRAFADRATYLADSDFVRVPVQALTDKAYAAEFRASIDRERASTSATLERPDPARFRPVAPAPAAAASRREGSNTTHFSVIDAEGNAVANTYTLNDSYGAALTVPGLGVLVNNTMDDFTTKPGAPNALFQLVQSEGNKVEPGKRPLSSMTPTIVVRDAQPWLVLGAPGGPRIISAVIEVTLNRLAFGDDLPLAVARPRFHHQWLPDALFVEDDLFAAAPLEALRARGHRVLNLSELTDEKPGRAGRVNAIERDPKTGELLGVADARGGNVARGY